MTARRIAGHAALAGGALVAAITLLGVSGLEPLKLNTTASLPKGLYVRTFETPRVGTIVWFPLPAALQAYVADIPGAAQWFSQPGNGLLKPVVGGAGDTVCRAADRTFSVNGRALGQAPAAGPGGRPLPAWQGCRTLQEGELAVFAPLLLDSLDSRLYGPVAAVTARVYRPLWTAAP
ncbi:MAG: S26 family signal peptidase [Rhodospirillales bacterium]|nr:S26 family signal peptidase [Rhodospirillales bacterium]